MIAALFNQQIRMDLELVETQKQELDSVLKELAKRRDDFSRELKEYAQAGATERELQNMRQDFVDEMEDRKSEAQKAAMKVLLPHQQQRLRELTTQFMMREERRQKKLKSGLLTEQMKTTFSASWFTSPG